LGNINGSENTAIGDEALESNAEGPANTAVGSSCLSGNTTGDGNTAIGTAALFANTTGGNNTAVGYLAGQNVTTANNVICIGANVAGANVDESCYIGNIFGATSSNGVAVLVNSDGRLGTVTSSKRFKEDVKPIDKASEALFALKPVSFHYKQNIDPTCAAQFGLVAEDVEKVNPDLVIRDKQGKPYTVRYDQINSMLLNEFLKEHRTVLDLEKQIAILSTTVKEQGTQIERVSARLELSRSAAQTVSNHR
jgi:hypothetical protein